MLGHELVLDNATFRLLGVAPAWTRYLVLDFRFAAVSDEKREGVLRLVVNQATGAMPDAMFEQIAPWLEAEEVDVAPPEQELPPAGSAATCSIWSPMPCHPGSTPRWRLS